jgi:hypothetical protein
MERTKLYFPLQLFVHNQFCCKNNVKLIDRSYRQGVDLKKKKFGTYIDHSLNTESHDARIRHILQ